MFAPDGGIYTCLETVGKKQHCIGYYNLPQISWTKAREKWFGKHVGNSKLCFECKFALLCGGNCAIKEFDGEATSQLCIRYNDLLKDAVNKAYSEYLTQNEKNE